MDPLPFRKMHGLGNDFVVFDARSRALDLSVEQVRAIADRHTGVGCDQLIIMEPPRNGDADVFMRIRNADGSEVEACGNATRCVASVVMKERGAGAVVIETVVGLLHAKDGGNDLITVDMGPVRLDWQDIPLAEAKDTLHMGIEEGPLRDPVGINVGNPHAVFFVDDAEAIPLETVGPRVEHHPLFPARINVEPFRCCRRRGCACGCGNAEPASPRPAAPAPARPWWRRTGAAWPSAPPRSSSTAEPCASNGTTKIT